MQNGKLPSTDIYNGRIKLIVIASLWGSRLEDDTSSLINQVQKEQN
jgi:hypothetical protein